MSAAIPASTDATLRASITEGDARTRATVVLDHRFQGLPDTAHGDTVLALFDAVCHAGGARSLGAVYHRRVPLERPLQLSVTLDQAVPRLALLDGSTPLVTGSTVSGTVATAPATAATSAPTEQAASFAHAATLVGGASACPLPVSRLCFACGIENPLGLQARLAIDEHVVGGVWEPRAELRGHDDTLATVALTTLLDEAAFWLGAAASGEAGMTTDLRITLHAPVAFGRRLVVTGSRDRVRPHRDDRRYWDTEVHAHEEDGTLAASARITFVAVRGAARKLVAGLLTLNGPDAVRAVFPTYMS